MMVKAAGAQIIQWKQFSEIVTKNINAGYYVSSNWNEYNLNPLTSNNWRASLVPAAAVIPALIAYINIVAVKKLVVEIWNFIILVYLLMNCIMGFFLLEFDSVLN